MTAPLAIPAKASPGSITPAANKTVSPPTSTRSGPARLNAMTSTMSAMTATVIQASSVMRTRILAQSGILRAPGWFSGVNGR